MIRQNDQDFKTGVMASFAETCRKAGVKLTHQRLEIFQEILAAHDHPSVEDLHKRLKKRMPTISLDTVYRTLDTFELVGMVNKVPVAKGPARYEACRKPHHHCVCSRCKSIMDVEWHAMDALELPAQTQQWGRVTSRHLQLYGVCGHCQSTPQQV